MRERLKSFIERAARLEEERRAIASDLKEVYAEANSEGYDVAALKALVKEAGEDDRKRAKREEREEILDTYRAALGQLADTPLGVATISAAREATQVSRAGTPAATPEDGAANQADHATAIPAPGWHPAIVANDRKSSPAQTGEAVTANAGTEAPPVSVSPGREPYTPMPIKVARKDEDIGIPAFLRRGDPECIVQAGGNA